MSLSTIIRKDFRMLLRSKSSTVAVLLGPLLVVLLVGLVFMNAGDAELIIGVHAEEFDGVAEYTQSLEEAFSVIDYTDARACAEAVKKGAVVACVSFEAGSPPKARVHVDPSDTNVVYAVIDRVTGQIENQTSVIRQGLASDLLDTMAKTSIKLRADADQLGVAKTVLDQQQERAAALAAELMGVRLDVNLVSRRSVAEAIEQSVTARDDYAALAEDVLDDLEAEVGNTTAVADYTAELQSIEDAQSADAEETFADLLSALGQLEGEVAQSQTQAAALTSQAATLRNSLGEARRDVGDVLASIEQSRAQLSALDISEQDLTRPVEPVLEPVVAEDDPFGFAFPYFIALIVMFTSVLLASTVVVRERSSSAYFRNFTTPTPDWMFVAATYLTTLIVVAVQLVIIYIVASAFMSLSFLKSLPTTALLLLVIASFFILLGMLLGYLLRSHEGVMLAAIAVSSALLFVSGLVLPLQTLPTAVQFLVGANPFVLSSELLKASLIFGYTILDVFALLLVLVFYAVALFASIMIVQRLARVRSFELSAAPHRISAFLADQEVPADKALSVGSRTVRSKRELLVALKELSDEEYEEYATHRKNTFADWVRDVYKDDKLAGRLRNKSRRGAISVLEKELA